MIKRHQPQIMINDRLSDPKNRTGDFCTPEGDVPNRPPTKPWEVCAAMNYYWGYHRDAQVHTSVKGVVLMTRKHWIYLLLTVVLLPLSTNADDATIQTIRQEAVRQSVSADGAGWPLPLAATWAPLDHNFSPLYQLKQIDQGHHLLLCFTWPTPDYEWNEKMRAKKWDTYWEPAIVQAARKKLPISLQRFQFEMELTRMDDYRKLPADKNPNVINLQGEVIGTLDPMGPIEAWRNWGTRIIKENSALQRIEKMYPDPPLVMFLSNNEHNILRPEQAETSKRFVDKYGTERDIFFKRKVFSEALIERYHALQDAMRQALSEPLWRQNVRFVAYDAFSPSFLGRWYGWQAHSYYTPQMLDWAPLAWDGGSPSYYTHNWASFLTDYTSSSIQIEAMNWVFELHDVYAKNPNFWFELSTWDGDMTGNASSKRLQYAARGGQIYTPQRYEGMLQFGLWLTRARALRDFRYQDSFAYAEPYYMANVNAVDRVYQSELLKQFWRHGQLVVNHDRPHPYRANLPDEIKARDRWFLLSTNLDPQKKDWGLYTEIPVFSLALVLGDKPNRQWLVYAHAPRGARTDVEILVPDYGSVTVDASVTGSFYVVDEKSHTTKTLFAGGPSSAIPEVSTQRPQPAEPVTFEATNIFCPDNSATQLQWDFGDGKQVQGKRVTHAYEKPGQYVVTLAVQPTKPDQSQASLLRVPMMVGYTPSDDTVVYLPLDRMPDVGVVREIVTQGGYGREKQITHLIYAAQPLELVALNHGGSWADDLQRSQVLRFTAIQNYVDLNIFHDNNYNTQPRYDSLGRNRTISLWFKTQDDKTQQIIYQDGSANSMGINLYIQDGRVHAGTWSSDIKNWEGQWLSAALTKGQWHHAVLVLDDAQKDQLTDCFRFYLDGKKIGSARATLNRPNWVRLGGDRSTRFADGSRVEHSPSMQGWLDDFAVYRNPMDDQAVGHLYNAQQSKQ